MSTIRHRRAPRPPPRIGVWGRSSPRSAARMVGTMAIGSSGPAARASTATCAAAGGAARGVEGWRRGAAAGRPTAAAWHQRRLGEAGGQRVGVGEVRRQVGAVGCAGRRLGRPGGDEVGIWRPAVPGRRPAGGRAGRSLRGPGLLGGGRGRRRLGRGVARRIGLRLGGIQGFVNRRVRSLGGRRRQRVAPEAVAEREVRGTLDVGRRHLGLPVERGQRACRVRADEVAADPVEVEPGAHGGDPQ